MYHRRKLKPEYSLNGFLPAIFAVSIFAILFIFFGRVLAYRALGVIILAFAIISLIPYSRTRNYGYLVSIIYLVSFSMYLFSIPTEVLISNQKWLLPGYSKFLLFITIVLMAYLIYLSATRRIKWRGSEVLEMAAQNVKEHADSYTPRPRPIANLSVTQAELRDFADFLQRKLVSLSFMEDKQLVCMPVRMGEEVPLIYKPDISYENRTWVAFGFDGNVSVNISHKDYLAYKDDLAFDELAESLGNLYIEFFELFRKNEAVRIIDRMDALRVSVFT